MYGFYRSREFCAAAALADSVAYARAKSSRCRANRKLTFFRVARQRRSNAERARSACDKPAVATSPQCPGSPTGLETAGPPQKRPEGSLFTISKMLKHGCGRGSGAIFSSLKSTESFIEFLRAVLEISQGKGQTKGEAQGALARSLASRLAAPPPRESAW